MLDLEECQYKEHIIATSKTELFLTGLRDEWEVSKNLLPILNDVILAWVYHLKRRGAFEKFPHVADYILFQCDLLDDKKICEEELLEIISSEMELNEVEFDDESQDIIPRGSKLQKQVFRIIRHPSRIHFLRHLMKMGIDALQREKIGDEFLLKELEKTLCGRRAVLKELLQRNNIEIYAESAFSEFTEYYISDTDMKESLVKILEKNGIRTLEELARISETSLNYISGIGVEKVQEIQRVLEKYNIKNNDVEIHYIKNGDEKLHNIYHFCGMSYNGIIFKIKNEIFGDRVTVFEMELSMNIVHILCAKGYLYETDVRKDKDKLLKFFKEEFPEYYLELETFYSPLIVLWSEAAMINCEE